MSVAVMAAVTCAPLTYVVARFDPFHCTSDPATKFDPFTVKVNVAPPAVALVGEMEVIEGVGLFTVKPN